MSANHKRPLLAFVLVALACSMIIANGVRSEAVISALRTGASVAGQHVVAGVEVVLTEEPRAGRASDASPETTPVGPVEVAAQRLFGGGPSVQPDGHRTMHGPKTKAHHAHSRSRGKERGHPDRAHGRGHDHGTKLGKANGRAHGKGHAQVHQDKARDD